MHLGWDVDVMDVVPRAVRTESSIPTPEHVVDSVPKAVASTQAGLLMGGLCDVLAKRIADLKEILGSTVVKGDTAKSSASPKSPTDSPKAAPMCHGLVLAIRYSLEEIDAVGILRDDVAQIPSQSLQQGSRGQWAAMRELWDNRVGRAVGLALSGFRVALTVVAEDVPDEPESPGAEAQVLQTGASKGPAQGNAYMFVNTNGYMEGEGEEERGSAQQRAIVASWLLLKECAALLARLVQMCPSEDSLAPSGPQDGKRRSKNYATALLDAATVHEIGNTLLYSLCRLRHMGAISEAHASLQSICETLLRYCVQCAFEIQCTVWY